MTVDDLNYEALIGRPFTGIGKQDCFALVREFYKTNFDIEIEDFVRPNDWNSDEIDLIEMHHERGGFEKITDWRPKDLRPGDVLCMAIGERNPNHLAVYVGNSLIVHHVYGRMSKAEELRDFWFNSTCYICRHPQVPDLRPVYPDVTIEDILRARNAAPTE